MPQDDIRAYRLGTLAARLLGPAQFAWNERPVALPNRKAKAILAFLILNDTADESRARLAGLLWSESEPSLALTSLRRALLELRQALQAADCPALHASHTQVTLDRASVAADTDALLDRLAAGEVPDLLLGQRHLHESLLAGFDDLDGEFAVWLREQRQALLARLLDRLLRGLRDTALPPARREQHARAALLLDPTHEEACRCVMRCAAEAGEIPAALRAYDDLHRLLVAELDMEPTAETQDLFVRIKRGELDPRPPSARITDTAPAGAAPPRLAVVPFRMLGPNPLPTWLAEGLVEDIVCMFATLRDPVVISSNSTRMIPPDRLTDLASIGRILDARYVVSGMLRTHAAKLRLTVELAETAGGAVLWKQNFDADEASLFDVHDKIVANVVHHLAPHLHQAELRRVRRVRPENLGAYHRLLQARELIFNLEPASFARAGALLRDAIRLEPGYANSHVTLSDWCSIRLGQGWSDDRAADSRTLDTAARDALRHDPGNAHAMAMLGHNRTLLDRDYDEALALFAQAEDLAPNDATVCAMSSPTHAFLGEPAEAIRRARRALSLSPRDPFAFRLHHFLSIGHFFADDHDAAAHWGRESLRENPNYTSNLRSLACILAERGQVEEARALGARAMAIQPDFRVGPAVARYPAREAARRERYGRGLLAAGLPA